jgi:hypothetical protein
LQVQPANPAMTKLAWTIMGLMMVPLLCRAALAQDGGPSVAFPQVTERPMALYSISGRWSSLYPRNRIPCRYKEVSGRVVSPRLLLVKEMNCGQAAETTDVLVNVQLGNPADTVQMVPGRRVVIAGIFSLARQYRSPNAFYIIAEKAEPVAGDPRTAPAPPFMSYMMCQPPELDALAAQIGSELCVQSSLVANLAATSPALEAAVRAVAKSPPDDKASNDPETIRCRPDPGLSDTHLSAIACARNSYWAWYAKMLYTPNFLALAPP